MLEKQAGDGQIALLQDVLFGVLSTLKGVEQGLAFSLRSLMPFNHQVPAAAAKSRQLCPTLCDPIDGSPPGSPVPGILQARILAWVAISFSSA